MKHPFQGEGSQQQTRSEGQEGIGRTLRLGDFEKRTRLHRCACPHRYAKRCRRAKHGGQGLGDGAGPLTTD
jgi:hypothetical protein